MNWYWVGPLAIGGVGAALFALFTGALQREARRLQTVKAEVERARRRPRGDAPNGFRLPTGRY